MDITLPLSAKPQLLRASHEWCTEQGHAPYLLVAVDGSVSVPKEFVKDGQIVLNTSYDATAALQFGDKFISFKARFGGVAREISVPVGRVLGLFSRETGQGVYFEESEITLNSGPQAQSDKKVTSLRADSRTSPAEVQNDLSPVKRDEPGSNNGDGDKDPNSPAPKGGGAGRPVLVRVK